MYIGNIYSSQQHEDKIHSPSLSHTHITTISWKQLSCWSKTQLFKLFTPRAPLLPPKHALEPLQSRHTSKGGCISKGKVKQFQTSANFINNTYIFSCSSNYMETIICWFNVHTLRKRHHGKEFVKFLQTIAIQYTVPTYWWAPCLILIITAAISLTSLKYHSETLSDQREKKTPKMDAQKKAVKCKQLALITAATMFSSCSFWDKDSW